VRVSGTVGGAGQALAGDKTHLEEVVVLGSIHDGNRLCLGMEDKGREAVTCKKMRWCSGRVKGVTDAWVAGCGARQ
jgi:hypothetical protein